MQGASSRTYYVAGPRFLASPPAPMPVPEVSTIPRNIHQAAPNSRQLSVDSRLLLGRQQKPLVRDDLTPMVGEAMLAHAIPEMENHPDQRCTVLIADAGTGSPP